MNSNRLGAAPSFGWGKSNLLVLELGSRRRCCSRLLVEDDSRQVSLVLPVKLVLEFLDEWISLVDNCPEVDIHGNVSKRP